jgi:TRAP-type C4-dicarboxylate transport system permease small subunit
MLDRVANHLKKVVSPISRVLGDISMVVIVLVTLFVVVDVCLRRFINSPIQGSHDLSSLAFSIIVFLPLAWCAINDGHVELDLLVKRLPKPARLSIEVMMMFITMVILGLMSWQLLIQGTKLQAANAESAILEIPMYPFVYLATLGSLMLALAFFIRFLYSLSNIIEERR